MEDLLNGAVNFEEKFKKLEQTEEYKQLCGGSFHIVSLHYPSAVEEEENVQAINSRYSVDISRVGMLNDIHFVSAAHNFRFSKHFPKHRLENIPSAVNNALKECIKDFNLEGTSNDYDEIEKVVIRRGVFAIFIFYFDCFSQYFYLEEMVKTFCGKDATRNVVRFLNFVNIEKTRNRCFQVRHVYFPSPHVWSAGIEHYNWRISNKSVLSQAFFETKDIVGIKKNVQREYFGLDCVFLEICNPIADKELLVHLKIPVLDYPPEEGNRRNSNTPIQRSTVFYLPRNEGDKCHKTKNLGKNYHNERETYLKFFNKRCFLAKPDRKPKPLVLKAMKLKNMDMDMFEYTKRHVRRKLPPRPRRKVKPKPVIEKKKKYSVDSGDEYDIQADKALEKSKGEDGDEDEKDDDDNKTESKNGNKKKKKIVKNSNKVAVSLHSIDTAMRGIERKRSLVFGEEHSLLQLQYNLLEDVINVDFTRVRGRLLGLLRFVKLKPNFFQELEFQGHTEMEQLYQKVLKSNNMESLLQDETLRNYLKFARETGKVPVLKKYVLFRKPEEAKNKDSIFREYYESYFRNAFRYYSLVSCDGCSGSPIMKYIDSDPGMSFHTFVGIVISGVDYIEDCHEMRETALESGIEISNVHPPALTGASSVSYALNHGHYIMRILSRTHSLLTKRNEDHPFFARKLKLLEDNGDFISHVGGEWVLENEWLSDCSGSSLFSLDVNNLRGNGEEVDSNENLRD